MQIPSTAAWTNEEARMMLATRWITTHTRTTTLITRFGLLPDVVVAEVINYNFSIAAAIGVVLFWNFAINRLWTFRNT